MKLVEIPISFRREVRAAEPDGDGWLVRFGCGHMVWFAVPVNPGDRYHCSVCFDQVLDAARAQRRAGR